MDFFNRKKVRQLEETIAEIQFAAQMSVEDLLELRAKTRGAAKLTKFTKEATLEDLSLFPADTLHRIALLLVEPILSEEISPELDRLVEAKEAYLAGSLPEDEYEVLLAQTIEALQFPNGASKPQAVDPRASAVVSACAINAISAFALTFKTLTQIKKDQ